MMKMAICAALLGGVLAAGSATRTETFDREPNWEGINNRSTAFGLRQVKQDFGYSPRTSRAGGRVGEVGGRIHPASEPAWYGYRLPKPLTFDSELSAEGKILVPKGPGHFLFGFFNTNTLNEWRTPNTINLRINPRGDAWHCHLEFCTSRWRADAGVIGHIVPGSRVDAKNLTCDKVFTWKLNYRPEGRGGVVTLTLDGDRAEAKLTADQRADGATFTHFGLLPVMKTWDSGGEVWIDDLTINGTKFDFTQDPGWEAFNNRREYQTKDTRPQFDFGWSATHWARGRAAGELGGLIFRGDCREPARMACYGDKIGPLLLNTSLLATGRVCMLRGVSDSTASIGFYHSKHSMESNPSQKHSIPSDYLGINIEGPSSQGFFFYPVYRVHGDNAKALGSGDGKAPRIYPDGKVHDWFLRYDPAGGNGHGLITVGLDQQVCTLELDPSDKLTGATFDRFGICTPWVDGNSVKVYFDDLTYTASAE